MAPVKFAQGLNKRNRRILQDFLLSQLTEDFSVQNPDSYRDLVHFEAADSFQFIPVTALALVMKIKRRILPEAPFHRKVQTYSTGSTRYFRDSQDEHP
jgi:hypothetical protein